MLDYSKSHHTKLQNFLLSSFEVKTLQVKTHIQNPWSKIKTYM